MNKFWGLVAYFFILITHLQAQTRLTGTIKDADNQDVLIGVNILVEKTDMGTITDENGLYELNLEAGDYTLSFSYVGFEPISKNISADGKTPLSLDIELKPALGDVIIVTDGKYEKKLEESTVSVDVISPKMLENNNITSLDEAVKKVSGVQIMDGQVSIRGGSGFAYGAGSRVSFLVDGQLLLSAELSDVKWNFVPLENAEQVEVIKGSASVLYGSGALNGVINVRTAYAKEGKPYTAFSLYSGVYDQPRVDSMRWYDHKTNLGGQPLFYGAFFAHREKITKKLDLVFGGNFHLSNGYIREFDERRFRVNTNLKYTPKIGGKTVIGLNTNLMYHEIETFFLAKDMGRNAYVPITDGGRDRYISFTLDPYLTTYDKFNNKHDLRGRWFMISKPRGGAPDNPPSVGNLFSFEYQFQRNFENGLIITAGNLTQHFRANSILFDTDPNVDRALFAGSSSGFYAQIDKKFFKKLNITAGIRQENFFIDTFFTAAPPVFRLGANWEINKSNFLRASYGQGFRFPSLAERFINAPSGEAGINVGIFPNPDLRPEIGWSTEFAYRHQLKIRNFRIYADAAFFWMEYKDMVEFELGSYPEGLGFKSVNVANARVAGWEFSTQGEGLIGKTPFRIWGGYTYSCPVNTASDTTLRDIGTYMNFLWTTFSKGIEHNDFVNVRKLLKYRSMHNFRMDAETELFGRWIVGGVANFNSYVHHVDLLFSFGIVPNFTEFRLAHNRGDWTFDLRAGYKINDKQRVNFVVNNLLNREYTLRPARMEAPRTFQVKYSHTF